MANKRSKATGNKFAERVKKAPSTNAQEPPKQRVFTVISERIRSQLTESIKYELLRRSEVLIDKIIAAEQEFVEEQQILAAENSSKKRPSKSTKKEESCLRSKDDDFYSYSDDEIKEFVRLSLEKIDRISPLAHKTEGDLFKILD